LSQVLDDATPFVQQFLGRDSVEHQADRVVDGPDGIATADDLLEAARTSGKGLTFASAGPGTVGQFAAELFRLGLASVGIKPAGPGAKSGDFGVFDTGPDGHRHGHSQDGGGADPAPAGPRGKR
jgi:hypothetical protein